MITHLSLNQNIASQGKYGVASDVQEAAPKSSLYRRESCNSSQNVWDMNMAQD